VPRSYKKTGKKGLTSEEGDSPKERNERLARKHHPRFSRSGAPEATGNRAEVEKRKIIALQEFGGREGKRQKKGAGLTELVDRNHVCLPSFSA